MGKEITFIVGNEKNYDEVLSERPVYKIGRNDPEYPDYDGGGVFRTAEAAFSYIKNNNHPYAVYIIELPTGWSVDVDEIKEDEEGFCRLLNNSLIIAKVEP